MKRPVLIHGALLSAVLVAAYFTWTRDQTRAGTEDEVQVLSLHGALDRVIYNGEERTVEIDRRKDDHGSFYWVRVDTMEAPPAPLPRPAPRPPLARPDEKKAGPEKVEPRVVPQVMPKDMPKVMPRVMPKAEPKRGQSLSHDPKADPEPKKAEAKKPEAKAPEAKKPEAKPATPPGIQAAPKGEPPKPVAKGEPPKPVAKLEPPKPAPKVRKVQEFKGNKSVEELMKGLANLSAVRSLGTVEPDKLKAFGLENPKKTLTLISGSSPRVFYVGGNTFGNMDMYIRSKDDGRVYVVRPRLLQDFQYAEFRLMDRTLHGFENNEVEHAVITSADGKKRTLVQQNRRDPAGGSWADEATPEQRKDIFRNWMGKVLGLKVLEYTPPDKKIDGLKPVLTVEYKGAGSALGFLRLYRREALTPTVGGPGEQPSGDFFAVTENTRVMVKLSRQSGDEVARDIANVMRE